MSEEKQLADWLLAPTYPTGLPSDIEEAIFILRPDLAPPPMIDIDAIWEASREQIDVSQPEERALVKDIFAQREAPDPQVSIDDIFAQVSSGPLAIKGKPLKKDDELIQISSDEKADNVIPFRAWYKRPMVVGGLAAAMALIILLPTRYQTPQLSEPLPSLSQESYSTNPDMDGAEVEDEMTRRLEKLSSLEKLEEPVAVEEEELESKPKPSKPKKVSASAPPPPASSVSSAPSTSPPPSASPAPPPSAEVGAVSPSSFGTEQPVVKDEEYELDDNLEMRDFDEGLEEVVMEPQTKSVQHEATEGVDTLVGGSDASEGRRSRIIMRNKKSSVSYDEAPADAQPSEFDDFEAEQAPPELREQLSCVLSSPYSQPSESVLQALSASGAEKVQLVSALMNTASANELIYLSIQIFPLQSESVAISQLEAALRVLGASTAYQCAGYRYLGDYFYNQGDLVKAEGYYRQASAL